MPYRRARLAECARKKCILHTTQSQDRIRMVGWSGRLIFLGQRNHLPYSLAPRYVSTMMALFILSLFAKKQKKDITLHYLSHHSFQTKVQTIKEFYRTAEASSSSPEYAEESKVVIDRLLRCNGYDNPRQYIDYRYKGRGVNKA